ncbi:hypothetical protein CBW42_04920 [Butyricicoccus porcorum]|uniref:Uncharacterized protein n=1 Tax=Butyricicoccus porcorum TaxID=1945634 RepID=A0A252F5I5_9FIRM|nr:hypothetical protein CBW42_04920 [Butyricicoccus porcorum]
MIPSSILGGTSIFGVENRKTIKVTIFIDGHFFYDFPNDLLKLQTRHIFKAANLHNIILQHI